MSTDPPAIDSGDCLNACLHSMGLHYHFYQATRTRDTAREVLQCAHKLAKWTSSANRCPVISFHTNAFTSDWELKETKHIVGFSRVQLCTLCDRHSLKMQKSLRGMTKMQKRVIISTRWKNTKVTTCARQYRPKLKVFMFCPVEEVHVRMASNQDGITSNIYHSIVHVQNLVDQLMRKTN